MNRPTLTPWFPGSVKPTRPGVYKTACGFQHWNGCFWGYFCSTPGLAAKGDSRRSYAQNERWRGLASDPAATVGVKGRAV